VALYLDSAEMEDARQVVALEKLCGDGLALVSQVAKVLKLMDSSFEMRKKV